MIELFLPFPGSILNWLISFGRNGYIRDPTTVQFLFEISQALHDDENIVNVKDDSNQPARLISSFVSLVTNLDIFCMVQLFFLVMEII